MPFERMSTLQQDRARKRSDADQPGGDTARRELRRSRHEGRNMTLNTGAGTGEEAVTIELVDALEALFDAQLSPHPRTDLPSEMTAGAQPRCGTQS